MRTNPASNFDKNSKKIEKLKKTPSEFRDRSKMDGPNEPKWMILKVDGSAKVSNMTVYFRIFEPSS